MRKIKQLQLFNKRGMEQEVSGSVTPMSKYQYTVLKQNLRRAKIIENIRIKRYASKQPKVFGETVSSLTYGNLPDETLQNLIQTRKSLDIDVKSASLQQIERLTSRIEKIKIRDYNRGQTYKENIQDMINQMAEYSSLSPEERQKLDDFLNFIEKMNIDDFMDMVDEEQMVKQLGNFYEGDVNKITKADEQQWTEILKEIANKGVDIANEYSKQ